MSTPEEVLREELERRKKLRTEAREESRKKEAEEKKLRQQLWRDIEAEGKRIASTLPRNYWKWGQLKWVFSLWPPFIGQKAYLRLDTVYGNRVSVYWYRKETEITLRSDGEILLQGKSLRYHRDIDDLKRVHEFLCRYNP